MTDNHAAAFRRLHQGPDLLILANAWDAGSARLFESLGQKAIATTSAGLAWSHGYPDGDVLPVPVLVAALAEIARVVRVPLTADIEAGYSDHPETVGETVARVIDAGAIGINIEDGAGPPVLLCAKIEQAKRAAAARGVDLFVNARADVFLRRLTPPDRALDETLERARLYREAGADSLFVPGAADPAQIGAIVAAAGLPVNILAVPGVPDAAALHRLGVRRLSAGTGICQALWNQAADLARGFMLDGLRPPAADAGLRYPDINALLAPPPE